MNMSEHDNLGISLMEAGVTKMNQITEENQDEHSPGFACAEVRKHLPQDLLSQITVLLQDSGYVTISPRVLTRADWNRINEKVGQMGGLWVSDQRYNHWSIPFARTSHSSV
jgi:hypothetical protein